MSRRFFYADNFGLKSSLLLVVFYLRNMKAHWLIFQGISFSTLEPMA